MGEQSHIAEIELQQVLAFRLQQRKFGVSYGFHGKCNARVCEVLKLVGVVAELLVSGFALYLFHDDALLFVLHVRRYEVVDVAYYKLLLVVIL